MMKPQVLVFLIVVSMGFGVADLCAQGSLPGQGSTVSRSRAAKMIIPEVQFERLPLSQALEFLALKSAEVDPRKRGMNFVYKAPTDGSEEPLVTLNLQKTPLNEVVRFLETVAGVESYYGPHAVLFFAKADAPSLSAALQKKPRGKLARRLMTERIPKLDFREASIEDATSFLQAKSAELASKGGGINFVVKPGVPKQGATAFDLRLRQTPMWEILQYTSWLGGYDLKAEDFAVVLSPN